MTMIDVYGFGKLLDAIVTVRPTGLSYKCREKRAALTVGNDCDSEIAFVRLDKGFYPEGNACDYSITAQKASPYGFLLELKGRHMKDAINQLSNTLSRLKTDARNVCYHQVCVISSGAQKIPSADWEKFQQAFLRKHHVRLVRSPNNSCVDFSKLAV